MRKFIQNVLCPLVMLFCFVLMIGILGGIENGQSWTNALWCIPLSALSFFAAYVGGYLF